MEKRYQQLLHDDFTLLLKEYNQHLYKAGQMVKLKRASAVFSCAIKEVNASGQLLVAEAAKDYFEFGEVEWVI